MLTTRCAPSDGRHAVVGRRRAAPAELPRAGALPARPLSRPPVHRADRALSPSSNPTATRATLAQTTTSTLSRSSTASTAPCSTSSSTCRLLTSPRTRRPKKSRRATGTGSRRALSRLRAPSRPGGAPRADRAGRRRGGRARRGERSTARSGTCSMSLRARASRSSSGASSTVLCCALALDLASPASAVTRDSCERLTLRGCPQAQQEAVRRVALYLARHGARRDVL